MEKYILDQNYPNGEKIILFDIKKNKKMPMIRKKIGNAVLLVALMSSLMVPTAQASNLTLVKESPSVTVSEGFENTTRLFIDDKDITVDSSDLLNKAINENKNLNNYERGILAQLKPLIVDNPYLQERNFENLATVSFNYKPDEAYVLSEKSVAAGLYYAKDNQIVIYNKFDDVLFHELLHCLSTDRTTTGTQNRNYDMNYKQKITEGMTQLLTMEYAYGPSNVYSREQAMVRILIELIGKDKVLEAYTKADYSIIIDELSKYFEEFSSLKEVTSKDTTISFLMTLGNYIDWCDRQNDMDNGVKGIDNSESAFKHYEELLKSTYGQLRNYFYHIDNQRGIDFDHDLVLNYYFSQLSTPTGNYKFEVNDQIFFISPVFPHYYHGSEHPYSVIVNYEKSENSYDSRIYSLGIYDVNYLGDNYQQTLESEYINSIESKQK